MKMASEFIEMISLCTLKFLAENIADKNRQGLWESLYLQAA